MTRDTLNLPSTRTWRDIPQPVVPRAMSREGKWRLVMAGLRVTAIVGVAAVCGWGTWLVTMSVRENSRAMPAAAKATPMKAPELRTDGVLDDSWLAHTLALPKNASLMELDLQALRAKLLAEDQVVSATLTRHFPDRLVVQISERSPVARVMTEWMGQQKALLVARDGVIYAGAGYDPGVLETLPWLDGVAITPVGGKFKPIDGMETAAELLAKARLSAEHLYNTWGVLSLAKLGTDERLEVRTKDGSYVAYFSTRDDFFRQLVKLNYICDQLTVVPAGSKTTIDLTLGADVPVTVVTPTDETTPNAKPAAAKPGIDERGRGVRALQASQRTAVNATFHLLQTPQPRKTKREL